jgi:hypothetical protein
LAFIVSSPFAGTEGKSESAPSATKAAITRPARASKAERVSTSSPTKINPKKIPRANVDKDGYNLDTVPSPEEKAAAEKAKVEKIATEKKEGTYNFIVKSKKIAFPSLLTESFVC